MEKNLFGKLFPKNIRFWAKSQGIVGVDIGSSSIKVVQLKKEKEQAVLETYGELATGPYAKGSVGQVVRLEENTVAGMLKDLVKESGITIKEAAVSIPVKDSLVTIIKLPLVSEKEMDEVVKFEARKYIPVPLSEVDLDWWILQPEKQSEEDEENGDEEDELEAKKEVVEVLLVAIHKGMVQKYQTILSKAGFKIKLFEIEIFSAWRSTVFRQATPVMIIDLGASSTKMSVIDGGLLRASHTIDRGAQALTSAISKSLKISFDRAEEMKRQIGISSKPEYVELVRVMDSVLGFTFSDAKQFMLNYRRKYNNSVGQVILTGGGALLKGIVDTAVKNLGVEVVLTDPFNKTEYPPFLQEALKEIGPSFSNAVGLALRGL